MAVTIASAASSKTVTLRPGESISFCGNITGTTTLTPKLSPDGGTTYYAFASPTDVTTLLSFSDTFGWVTLHAPSKPPMKADEYFFRLETSGAGSWSVEGVPA